MIKKIQRGIGPRYIQPKTTPRTSEKNRERRAQETEVLELKAAQSEAHRNSNELRGDTKFTYRRGPDGNTYVVEATTSLDTSPVLGNPEATLRKMEAIQQHAKENQQNKFEGAAEQARRNSRVAKASIQSSGLDEHEVSFWGETIPRLGEAFDKGEYPEQKAAHALSDAEQAVDIYESKTGTADKGRRNRRALNTYRGSGTVKPITNTAFYDLSIKAK